ncbi:hypothetical protein ASE07_25265 [Noviherbaspirillum sp. Root189]|nr:hypothetical protein ASE07_25265 [Noviherbaspirillum sp. Root189]
MRRLLSSFGRLIATVLLMTFLTSGIAMAAYVCPELAKPTMPEMMEGMPCAEMDKEKPVHCVEAQVGDKLALEHFATPPTLSPPTISFVIPAIAAVIPPFRTSFWSELVLDSGNDPPYLRTQRLRI